MQKINLDKARKLINELEDKLNATTEHTADARKTIDQWLESGEAGLRKKGASALKRVRKRADSFTKSLTKLEESLAKSLDKMAAKVEAKPAPKKAAKTTKAAKKSAKKTTRKKAAAKHARGTGAAKVPARPGA